MLVLVLLGQVRLLLLLLVLLLLLLLLRWLVQHFLELLAA
jgi:hypothetical protein